MSVCLSVCLSVRKRFTTKATDRPTCEKQQSPASSKGGIITHYIRKQVALEHTQAPQHDTKLIICENHEATSLTLLLYNMKKIFSYSILLQEIIHILYFILCG